MAFVHQSLTEFSYLVQYEVITAPSAKFYNCGLTIITIYSTELTSGSSFKHCILVFMPQWFVS